jgi:hypothetical protein
VPPLYTPVPATWTAGEVVKAPALRADISGTVQLLNNPPMFSGSQTVTSQSIPNGTVTAVVLNTETYDNLSGHQVSASPPNYYGMFPGYYLVECGMPLSYTGGVGMTSALIGGVQNGGANTAYGGMRVANASGSIAEPTCAKLMQMVATGTYGGAANDYLYPAIYQSATVSENMAVTAFQFPYLTARWVCANTGTAGLPVPANPAWPVPPTVLGHVFANASIRDACSFLLYPPTMEAVRTSTSGTVTSQSSLPLVGTVVSMGTKVTDNYTAYSTSTNTWTAPVAGRYYAYGCSAVLAGADGVALGAGLTVNSANYNGGTTTTLWGGLTTPQASSTSAAVVRRQLRLNAGDTLQLAVFYNDSPGGFTASYNTTPTWQSRMIVVWTGA